MIVDFHHHFTPRELIKEDPGDRLILTYDENGAPSYTTHKLLFDMDARLAMMDASRIDVCMMSCAAGMSANIERSRLANDTAKRFEKDHPKRFIGFAHANPLGGPEHMKELARCADELGFPGVTITSEQDGLYLDAPDYEPFWTECERRGLFVFVHPALKLNESKQFNAYDLARSTGREFSLVLATIRLINAQVFDRHPKLVVHMSHLAGGIASILGRLRSYQDKEFWGTKGNKTHGITPAHDLDYYIRTNMIFDTGGFCGEIASVKTALCEIPADRIVFGTDWPQEIRSKDITSNFVTEIGKLGADGEKILRGTAKALLKGRI
jgi:predicted TIM-barrel fold metal-dependent hydrolase